MRFHISSRRSIVFFVIFTGVSAASFFFGGLSREIKLWLERGQVYIPPQLKEVVVHYDSDACKDIQDKELCWQEYFRDLAMYAAAGEAMRAVRELHEKGIISNVCHNYAHLIGRASSNRFKDDYSSLLLAGEEICAWGYFHGVTEELTSGEGENLGERIRLFCEGGSEIVQTPSNPPLENRKFQCYHGVGHTLIVDADYQLDEALKKCEDIAPSHRQNNCFAGLFHGYSNAMIGVDPHSFSLSSDLRRVPYDEADPLQTCREVAPRYQEMCVRDFNGFVHLVAGRDITKSIALCRAGSVPRYVDICVEEVSKVHAWTHLSPNVDFAGFRKEFEALADEDRVDYIRGVMIVLVAEVTDDQKTALDFCALFTQNPYQDACYKSLGKHLLGVYGLEKRSAVCEKAPVPWRSVCENAPR